MKKDKTWNLQLIRNLLEKNEMCTADDRRRLIATVNSVEKYIYIFRYHGFSIKDQYSDYFKNPKISDLERFKFLSGMSPNQQAFRISVLSCEANFLGCIHTVRNIYDVFSQLVNALLLDSSIAEDKCNIGLVRDKLNKGLLKDELNALTESNWYKYAAAFSNQSKHRYLIKTATRVTIHDNKFDIHLEGFDYNERKYDSYTIEEALNGLLETLNQIIQCGRSLNYTLLSNTRAGLLRNCRITRKDASSGE